LIKRLTYCRKNKGQVHFVVVHNLTRFAREKFDHFSLRAHLRGLGTASPYESRVTEWTSLRPFGDVLRDSSSHPRPEWSFNMRLVLDLEKPPSALFSKRLVRIRFIQHIQIDLTVCRAPQLATKINFLNQAYVVQLIAFWQVFIEELAEYGFRKLTALERAGESCDATKVKLTRSLNAFNTPNKANIDRLFQDSLGIQRISDYWNSGSLPHNQASTVLGKLLTARHQIAHTGQTSEKLSFKQNFDRMEILMRAASLTERALIEQLTVRYNTEPT
jgi:hypothetical protein